MLAAAAMLAVTAPVEAQDTERFAFEVRGIGSFGHIDAARAPLSVEPECGWGVGVSYYALPYLSVFIGYDRAPFGCQGDGVFCAPDPVFTSAGLAMEVRAGLPFGRVRPWIGLGTGYRTLTTEWEDHSGARSERSGAAPALSASAGAVIPVGRGFSLGPTARYMVHDRPVPGGTAERVSVVNVDFGIRYHY
jgi:hypothetical protein